MNRNAVFASGVAKRMSDAIAMIAPAPTQTPSTAAMIGLPQCEHRLHQIAGHAREGEQALHVHRDQRADDVVHVAAGAEVAAVRAEDDRLHVVGVGQRAEGVAQLCVALEGQRVLPLRPVERDHRDGALHAERKCARLEARPCALIGDRRSARADRSAPALQCADAEVRRCTRSVRRSTSVHAARSIQPVACHRFDGCHRQCVEPPHSDEGA